MQGSPLSPLLSNVVLDELDKELEKRGLEFCRFADDCNIFARTQRGAERIMTSIRKFIENKLKLKANEDKSKTRKSNEVKFLGMTIVEGTIAISKTAYNKAMEKAKFLIPRGTHILIKDAIAEVNKWYQGWSSYFKMTQYPAQLKAIEAHIRRRFRARIIRQQKKKQNTMTLLQKYGISKKAAGKTVYSNRGSVEFITYKSNRESILDRMVYKTWTTDYIWKRTGSLVWNRKMSEVSMKSRVRIRTHGSV